MKIRGILLTLALLASTGSLYGQGGFGTILGTVTDTSGGVVAKAQVTVTNTTTNVSQVIESNEDGNYEVPYLRPATYRVTVEAPGFQKAVVDNITLVVDQKARVDAAMKAGAVTETITVNATTVALD